MDFSWQSSWLCILNCPRSSDSWDSKDSCDLELFKWVFQKLYNQFTYSDFSSLFRSTFHCIPYLLQFHTSFSPLTATLEIPVPPHLTSCLFAPPLVSAGIFYLCVSFFTHRWKSFIQMLMWVRSCVSVEISPGPRLIVCARTCRRESIFHAFTRRTNPQTGATLPTHIYTRNARQKIMHAFFWVLFEWEEVVQRSCAGSSHNTNIHLELPPCPSVWMWLAWFPQPTCSLACTKKLNVCKPMICHTCTGIF